MTRRILTPVLLLGTVPAWIAAPPLAATDQAVLLLMAKVERRLEAGEWTAAERALEKLGWEIAQRDDDDARPLLGRVAAGRALAYAGLGRGEEALWYWNIAQNLDPELRAGARFPSFGAAGLFFAGKSLRPAGEMPPGLRTPEAAPNEDFVPPGPLFVPVPEAPPDLRRRGWASDRLRVEVLVGVDGRIRSPVVLEGELPGKIYLGLGALREWSFAPALAAKQPVDALVTLTDFTVPRSFAFAMARLEDTWEIHELLMSWRFQEAADATDEAIAAALDDARYRMPETVGSLTALRALAEAGLERPAEALATWHLAHAFDPSLGWFDLGAYGAGGRLLAGHPVRCREDPASCGAVGSDRPADFRPPQSLDAPAVRLTPEVLPAGEGERIVVRLLVNAEGRVREPKILAGHSPAAVYRALEAVAGWRFEPATAGGRPVAAVHELTVPLAPVAPAAEIEGWHRRLEAIEDRLRGGDARGALPEIEDLIAGMVAGVGRGGSDLLAQAVAQRALAEAGEAEGVLKEAAVWHWQVAQNLAVELRGQPLTAYGPAGEFLARHRLPPWPVVHTPVESDGDDAAASGITAPGVVEARMPRYPEGDLLDLAMVEVEVDGAGRPHSPVVLRGRHPGRLYTALEALREWRFATPTEAQPRRQRVAMPLARLRPLDEIKALHRRRAETLPRSPGEVGPALHRVQWKEAKELLTTALKLAGRGEPRGALRRWYRAQSLVPALILADLTAFGRGGELLDRHRAPIAGHWMLPSPGRGDAAGEPPAERPLQVGGDVEKPVSLFAPLPEYTPEARAARIQGDVVVAATIDRDGRIRALRVLEGLPMGLTEHALAALSAWRFRPATRDGSPVVVTFELTVSFSLR